MMCSLKRGVREVEPDEGVIRCCSVGWNGLECDRPQMMFDIANEDPKIAIRHKMAYLMTLFTLAVFACACFFKFAVDVIFFLARRDPTYAHWYIYGAILYMTFSILLIFHVARCVVEHSIESFDKIQELKNEERDRANEKNLIKIV